MYQAGKTNDVTADNGTITTKAAIWQPLKNINYGY